MKDKKVSILLSLLFPGFGHLYIGSYIDAVVFIAGTGVLWYAFFVKGFSIASGSNPKSYLVLGALIFVYLLSIFDALRKTK